MTGGIGSLRSAAPSGDLKANIQQHAQTHAQTNSDNMSENMSKMMASLTGGRKKRSRRSTSRANSKKRHYKKGGMALGGIVRDALVPFGLYALQKRSQRNHKGFNRYKKTTMQESRKKRLSRKSRR